MTMMVLLRSKGNEQGESLPPGAPCGVACGQALQPCGLSGGLTPASRLRRACTPFCNETIQGDKNQIQFCGVPDPALTAQSITYLSGKCVHRHRTTSGVCPTTGSDRGMRDQTLLVRRRHGTASQQVLATEIRKTGKLRVLGCAVGEVGSDLCDSTISHHIPLGAAHH